MTEDSLTLCLVLLRVLEYYNGILILTTNRLRQFNHAVLSRVNLAVKYEDLNTEQKKKIFNKFINQLKDTNTENIRDIRNWIEMEETMDYFEKLNGRQIRNILFSAASLASGREGGKMKLSDIKKIARVTKNVAQDLDKTIQAARMKAETDRHERYD